jgi:nitrogen fixation NifU-like protein
MESLLLCSGPLRHRATKVWEQLSDFTIRRLRFARTWNAQSYLRYDSSMFSELVLDHFRNPRNAGKVPKASAEVQATNPVCGDILELSVRIENDGIAEARFLCRGCTTSIACASFLTEQLTGNTLASARLITPETISEALGGLPPATFHGAQLAADALAIVLAKLA